MKTITMSLIAIALLATIPAIAEDKISIKRKLKGNMTEEYLILPEATKTIGGMFTEGVFYGRLRSNSFYWEWEKETWDKATKKGNLNNKNMGMGGSMIFKSAYYNGIAFTAGYYGSINPDGFRVDVDEVGGSKAGKDTFSRYNVKKTGTYDGGMHILGQAYLEYKNKMFNLMAGRQLFESVFTSSNDTKMIPNTFDGGVATVKIAQETKLRVAYFGNQKLRDHTSIHDVITFKDSAGDSWNNNDDAPVHQGLSYANFKKAGEDTDHDLIIADINTKIVKNLNATLSLLSVPDVVKDVVVETLYTMPILKEWSITPSIRYYLQMDDGAGKVAGYTNLTGNVATGYVDSVKTSIDSSLLNAKIDLNMPNEKGLFRIGYSKVEDKADILAPWRGFPTGGYTRAMGQYNWYANTKTFMGYAEYKFTSSFNGSVGYAVQDFDDKKVNAPTDSNVWHIDLGYKFNPVFYSKIRVGLISEDPANSGKNDNSYKEYRLEFNYLF